MSKPGPESGDDQVVIVGNSRQRMGREQNKSICHVFEINVYLFDRICGITFATSSPLPSTPITHKRILSLCLYITIICHFSMNCCATKRVHYANGTPTALLILHFLLPL